MRVRDSSPSSCSRMASEYASSPEQQPVLQLRQRRATELRHRRGEPALHRGASVGAKVVVVLEIDRVDQESPLDLEIARRGVGDRYFGIHTRTSERSFSTSSGLAM